MTDVWTNLLGAEMHTKDGIVPTASLFAGKQVVGLYFSAHWCPPCRAFTPVLSTTYDELKDAHGDAVEFVFVSSDSDAASFGAYYSEMPFAALPFVDRARKQQLSTTFQVSSIPTLVFFDAHGDVVTKDGDEVIRNANGDMDELWTYLTT